MKRKNRSQNDITGVTTKRGKVIRIWYGRDICIDAVNCTQCKYSLLSLRLTATKSLSDDDVKKAVRQAKKWLRQP